MWVPLLAVLGVLTVGLLGYVWWLGFFSTMEINEDVFPGGTFVYVDWKGEVKNIKEPFMKIAADFQKTGSKVTVHYMGIYYDDPGNLQNPSDFRACLGYLIT